MKTRLSKQAAVRPFANGRVDARAQGKASAERRLRRKSWPLRHAALLSVMAVVVLLAVIRLRVADVPLERDEGEYAYSGQLILQGIPPYQLAYNMKFPGTYYAYSVILAVFGETPYGIHAGLLLVNAATVVMLFFLARRLLADSMGAAVSAVAFGVLSVDRWIMGTFAHATHFVVLAAIAGFLVLFCAQDSKKPVVFAAAGALLGLSVLMKQNGIFFLGIGIVAAAWTEVWSAPRNFRAASLRAGLVAGGAAVPFTILCGVFFVRGVFGKFWFWTFQYAKEYVSRISLSQAWNLFALGITTVTRANKLLWLVAAAGVVMLWIVRWSRRTRILLTVFLITSIVSVCPGFYFREHYFILLVPAAGLFCGVAVVSIHRLLKQIIPGTAARAVAAGVFAVAVGVYVANEWEYLFSMPPNELSRARYGSNPFVEAPEIARYIQAHTDREERIAVLGSEPEIYFYANRKSATGYIYTYALMEQQKYSPRMQDEMIDQVTAAHPKYVIFVTVPTSWLPQNPKEKILTWSEAYINQCYSMVGAAEILSENQVRWLWDAEIAGYKPQSPYAVYTFKRKSDAPCAVTG